MFDYLVAYLNVLFTEMPILALVAVGGIAAVVLRRWKPRRRDDAASRALDDIARRAEVNLRSRAIPFSAVTSTWSYGWPKIQIEFENAELEAKAKAGGYLKILANFVYDCIQAEPAFGEQASKIGRDRTVWLKVKGQPGYRHP